MVAVGTSVQSYPFKTLVTASFISLLSSCGDGAEPEEDADVPICMGVAVAAVDGVVTDDVGERDKEPELSISKGSPQEPSNYKNIAIYE